VKRIFALTALIAALVLAGCSGSGDTFTLYRSSPVNGDTTRIQVATFDAKESGTGYNQGNCITAARLFQDQPGVTVHFWCERGRFKP
jgi:hypothetical protein